MVLPLSFVDTGQEVTIHNLPATGNLKKRLSELGLNCGTKITVLKNDLGGPLILSQGNGRIALGRGMAQKIMVETN